MKILGISRSSLGGISRSSLGDSYAHCDYCKCDFSIAHSGSFDIQGHLKTKKHTNYLSLARDAKAVNQPKLNMFMPSSSSTLSAVDRDIIRAEVMVTESLVKMNASLSSADVFTKVVKAAFPDSKIAQGYSCCRNKTTAIINSMAEKEKDDIKEQLQQSPFCVSTDGSNDKGGIKQFPVVISSVGEEGIVTRLLSVSTLKKAATGENILPFKL